MPFLFDNLISKIFGLSKPANAAERSVHLDDSVLNPDSFFKLKESDNYISYRYNLNAADIDQGGFYFQLAVCTESVPAAAEFYHKSLCCNVNASCLLNLSRIRKLQCRMWDALYLMYLARIFGVRQKSEYLKDIKNEYAQLVRIGSSTFLNKNLRQTIQYNENFSNVELDNLYAHLLNLAFNNNEVFKYHYLFDELDSMIQYEEPSDYPLAFKFVRKFDRHEIESKFTEIVSFVNEYRPKKDVLYGLVSLFDKDHQKSVREGIISYLYRKYFAYRNS